MYCPYTKLSSRLIGPMVVPLIIIANKDPTSEELRQKMGQMGIREKLIGEFEGLEEEEEGILSNLREEQKQDEEIMKEYTEHEAEEGYLPSSEENLESIIQKEEEIAQELKKEEEKSGDIEGVDLMDTLIARKAREADEIGEDIEEARKRFAYFLLKKGIVTPKSRQYITPEEFSHFLLKQGIITPETENYLNPEEMEEFLKPTSEEQFISPAALSLKRRIESNSFHPFCMRYITPYELKIICLAYGLEYTSREKIFASLLRQGRELMKELNM